MICQDYNQPLLIPAGGDSLLQIGGATDKAIGDNVHNIWKLAYTTRYPQVHSQTSILIQIITFFYGIFYLWQKQARSFNS